MSLGKQPFAKGADGRAIRDDLGADQEIGRRRLHFDRKRLHQAPRLEVGIDERAQRERDAELLRSGLEREHVGREARAAAAVHAIGDAGGLQPFTCVARSSGFPREEASSGFATSVIATLKSLSARLFTWWLTAVWVMASSFAASLNDRWRAAASNTRSAFSGGRR